MFYIDLHKETSPCGVTHFPFICYYLYMEKGILKSRIALLFLSLTAVLLLTAFILILINVDNLSYPLIIHFNPYEGVNLTGGENSLWSILIIGLVIITLNTFLGNVFFKRERIVSYVFFVINFIIAIMTLISIAQIISIN